MTAVELTPGDIRAAAGCLLWRSVTYREDMNHMSSYKTRCLAAGLIQRSGLGYHGIDELGRRLAGLAGEPAAGPDSPPPPLWPDRVRDLKEALRSLLAEFDAHAGGTIRASISEDEYRRVSAILAGGQ